MSDFERDGLVSCLFSRQGMMLDNVKFFRGEAKVIREADFRKEFCDAEDRRRDGTSVAGDVPSFGSAPVDVRKWVVKR